MNSPPFIPHLFIFSAFLFLSSYHLSFLPTLFLSFESVLVRKRSYLPSSLPFFLFLFPFLYPSCLPSFLTFRESSFVNSLFLLSSFYFLTTSSYPPPSLPSLFFCFLPFILPVTTPLVSIPFLLSNSHPVRRLPILSVSFQSFPSYLCRFPPCLSPSHPFHPSRLLILPVSFPSFPFFPSPSHAISPLPILPASSYPTSVLLFLTWSHRHPRSGLGSYLSPPHPSHPSRLLPSYEYPSLPYLESQASLVGPRFVAGRLDEPLTCAQDVDGVDVGEDVFKGELHVGTHLVRGRGGKG